MYKIAVMGCKDIGKIAFDKEMKDLAKAMGKKDCLLKNPSISEKPSHHLPNEMLEMVLRWS